MTLPLLIVKTGDTLPELHARLGDFEDWIAQGLAQAQTGLPVQVADPRGSVTLPDPSSIAGVVVTGSHAMVSDRADWSEATAAWLAQAVAEGVPVLGICYGHQLLAHALGGEVNNHPQGLEMGTTQVHTSAEAANDPLMAHLPPVFAAQVAHRQSVRHLPPGAVLLAGNGFEPHHACRVGPSAWGVQFHPEFGPEASTGYVQHLQADLRTQGLDPTAMAARVTASPEAASLLARFATLVATREPAPATR